MSAPEPNRRTMRPALRGFWLTVCAVSVALTIFGVVLARAHRQLSWAEAWVEEGSTSADSERAQHAIDDWMRPWVERFLDEHGRDPAQAAQLERCAAELLTALDDVSQRGNVVLQGPIDQAVSQATRCAGTTLGERQASAFVSELRQRWGTWLQEEEGQTTQGPG